MTTTAKHPARALLRYTSGQWPTLLVAGVFSLATTATGLALPLVVRELINRLGSERTIGGLLLLMTFLVAANALIGTVGSYLLQRAAESVVLAARRHLVGLFLRLRLTAVESTEPGDLISRATSDTTLLSDVATASLIGGFTGAIALIATLGMMLFLDPPLSAVTVAALLGAVAVIGLAAPRIRRAAEHAQQAIGSMSASMERALGALRTVKAATAEELERTRIEAAAERTWRSRVHGAAWSALAANTAGLAAQAAFVAVLTVGGARVASGAITVGTLVAFLLYIYYLIPPVQSVAGAFSQYQYGAAAIRRIQQVDALPSELIETAATLGRAASPDRARHEPVKVSFVDVSLRYAPDLPLILANVSFDISAPGLTALVGPSGAGKTSALSLIERFYDASTGQVLVNGRNVQDWHLPELRRTIGYVEQEAPLLSGTIRENVTYGVEQVDPHDIDKVLRTTRLSDLIASAPAGLETLVGPKGMRLSGGERQRVAIARALLRSPSLLLLDEATSQLDALNEAALRETLADVARQATVIAVAHRLSTIVHADHILVFDAGRLRGGGRHDELLATDPLYASLVAAQSLADAASAAGHRADRT